jgi:hypothetical protein
VTTDVALHWINVRWPGFEDTRPHVRCIRAIYQIEDYIRLETIEGRRLEFFCMDEDPDSKDQIIEINRRREKNRAAYDRQTVALLDEAKGMAGYNPSN